jgi:hypothetical protein
MKAVDQLLGYHSWRDSKAAILLFIDRQNAAGIVAKAREAMKNHVGFISESPPADPTRRTDYVLASRRDEGRHVRVALLPFVVPGGRDKSAKAMPSSGPD